MPRIDDGMSKRERAVRAALQKRAQAHIEDPEDLAEELARFNRTKKGKLGKQTSFSGKEKSEARKKLRNK